MNATMDAVSPKDQFLAGLPTPNESDAFAAHRALALGALTIQEIPTTRVEAWKYTRVAKLFKKAYQPFGTVPRISMPPLENGS